MSSTCHRIASVTLLCVIAVFSACSAATPHPNRTLRVALYPFVPDKDGLFREIKSSFERAHPDVELKIVDLSDNYYNESKPDAVTNTNADVWEIDSVFLDDFAASGKIRPLPQELSVHPERFVPVARAATTFHGVTYTVPHWVCTNYLFTTRGDDLARSTTLEDMTRAIPATHAPSRGLLVDLKGQSTLGELYLDALLDRDRTFEKAAAHLTLETLDSSIAQVLVDLRGMCDSQYCRDTALHNDDSSYARLFAHEKGRALIGYSERLYFIERELNHGCRPHGCISLSALTVIAPPLAQSGVQPFAWVDGFAIAKGCVAQCLSDAQEFIAEVTSGNAVRSTLIPQNGDSPRYLLPAVAALYNDKALLKAAPLYAQLYPAVKDAIPVRALGLNQDLRAIGGRLDNVIIPK